MAALPASVEEARTASIQAAKQAGEYGAAEPTITDALRQKITEAYSGSQDIIGPLDKATQTYLSAPQAGREKYQDIFNPFTRESLVSKYVGTEALPMLSLSSMLGQRFGRIEDTIGAGVRGFQSAALAKQAEADLARQTYQDLFDEYVTLEKLRQSGTGGGGTGSLGYGGPNEGEMIIDENDNIYVIRNGKPVPYSFEPSVPEDPYIPLGPGAGPAFNFNPSGTPGLTF